MHSTPPTLFAAIIRALKKPTPNMLRNTTFATFSRHSTSQPVTDEITVLEFHLARERTIFRPQVIDRLTTCQTRLPRFSWVAHPTFHRHNRQQLLRRIKVIGRTWIRTKDLSFIRAAL
jgi:hypothetical protein